MQAASYPFRILIVPLFGFISFANSCSPQNRQVVLQPLDWDKVNQIAEATLDKTFSQVDKSHITAQDFRLYTYELDHNGNPKEEFIQSFEYNDPEKGGFLRSSPSIGCRITPDGNVSMSGNRGFPFRPAVTDLLTPIKLDLPLRTPDFGLIDQLAKSAVGEKVNPETLVFLSLTVGYRSHSSVETYSIMFYDSSSVGTKIVEGRKIMFYTWIRIQLDRYGGINDIMWHTPEMNLEGRTDGQLANLPHPPASVLWPPNR